MKVFSQKSEIKLGTWDLNLRSISSNQGKSVHNNINDQVRQKIDTMLVKQCQVYIRNEKIREKATKSFV